MECSCCGNERDQVVALQCHDEIKVCAGCIGWLRGRAGMLDVTPILPVRDAAEAVAFYERAGFHVHQYGDGYSFVHYDDESVFDLDLAGPLPAAGGAGAFMTVPDVDGWHARLTDAGLPVTAAEDKPWGMREFTLTDPSGNYLRIGHALG